MKINEECLFKPIMLFIKNGKTLQLQGTKNLQKSKIFLITSIKEKCITLMHLDHCPTCISELTLNPTNTYTVIESNAIHGYHFIENVRIEDCNHCNNCKHCNHCNDCNHCNNCNQCNYCKCVFTDCISGKISIQPKNSQILWKSLISQQQYGRLRLWIDEQSLTSTELFIYDYNDHVYRYRGVDMVYLEQCKLIIIKSSVNRIIKGTFKIEVESTVNPIYV